MPVAFLAGVHPVNVFPCDVVPVNQNQASQERLKQPIIGFAVDEFCDVIQPCWTASGDRRDETVAT